MRIAVTGATGFVGDQLVAEATRRGHAVRSLVRQARNGHFQDAVTGDLSGSPDWLSAIAGCEVVIHTAARVHQMVDSSSDPLVAYRLVNTQATAALAQACIEAGVRRLVFLSSIKVNGERTRRGQPFRADDAPAPADPYAISKWEAEQALWAIAKGSALEIVIVRLPLVYGPGVGANLERLIRWLARGRPLPFGRLNNQRSLIGIENLCDLLLALATLPAAAGALFLASDDDDLSTTRLARILRDALGSASSLLPVPPTLIAAGAALVGRRSLTDRLLGNLQVDISATRARLGWSPPVSAETGLRRAVSGFVEAAI